MQSFTLCNQTESEFFFKFVLRLLFVMNAVCLMGLDLELFRLVNVLTGVRGPGFFVQMLLK